MTSQRKIAFREFSQQCLLPSMSGVLVGTACFAVIGPGLLGVESMGDPLQMHVTFRPTWTACFATLGIAIFIVVAALNTSIEEFWIRASLGVSVGFLVFGLWWQTFHRIDIATEGFDIWTFNPYVPKHYSLGNGSVVYQEFESRPWSRFGDRQSVHYRSADGHTKELCHDTRLNLIWIYATPHLIQVSRNR